MTIEGVPLRPHKGPEEGAAGSLRLQASPPLAERDQSLKGNREKDEFSSQLNLCSLNSRPGLCLDEGLTTFFER